jgi:threonine dehydrogenase-like Zn-dependent dehydrogenase
MSEPRPVTAAVAVEALRTELQRFPLPDVNADEGLLEIEVAGVCGTDWEIYERKSRGAGLGPLILGHENVGRIAAIGDRAAKRWGIDVGHRIAVEEFIPCGHCIRCLSGESWLCDATDSRAGGSFLRYGSTSTTVPPALWGGFGQYQYLHPNSLVHRIDENLPTALAALFVPISNGIRWVRDVADAPLEGSILIQGPGQHGLGCVVAAKEAGMATIIVSGLSASPERLEVARALGADHTFEADRADVVSEVKDVTGGRGADVVIDVTPGATRPVEIALEAAAKRGTIVLVGSKHGRPVSGFKSDMVVRKELTVRGVRGRDYRSVELAFALIGSGRYPLERLCTHTFGLDQVDRALHLVGELWDPAAIHVNVVPN